MPGLPWSELETAMASAAKSEANDKKATIPFEAAEDDVFFYYNYVYYD